MSLNILYNHISLNLSFSLKLRITRIFLKILHHFIYCDRWLAKDEDDKKICRDLKCSNAPGHTGDLIPFEIEVHTGKKSQAGTDANVFIELHSGKGKGGKERSSGRVPLVDGKFEKGQKDKFKLDFPKDTSPCSYITIGHDNKGVGAGWFLDKVNLSRLKLHTVVYMINQMVDIRLLFTALQRE